MKSTALVIASLSLLAISCADTSMETAESEAAAKGSIMSRIDREELCSSVRRVSKDAVNGFAVFKAGERTVPVAKTESMSRVYREYQENETWFHMPEARDCYISSSLDRPPGTMRWADYRCRWLHSTRDQAKSAYRDLNRYIELCLDSEEIEVRQEKDGQKLARRIFRSPEASLHLYTAYYTATSDDEVVGPSVVDLVFQASRKP